MLIVPVVMTAYVATNLDNLLLLIGLLAQHPSARAKVFGGYAAGMLALGLVSLAVGKAAEAIPVAYLGWLGVIPISAGVYALISLLRDTALESAPTTRTGPILAITALTQMSNGADTVATFSILIADSATGVEGWLAATFVLMIGAFAVAASYALRHPWLGKRCHPVRSLRNTFSDDRHRLIRAGEHVDRYRARLS